MNIRTPRTSFIGTDEFDIFLEKNNLHDVIHGDFSYEEIKELFVKGQLSYHLEKKLRSLLEVEKRPLAIRSSSLLEDSTTQPFAGIFDTFFLPNNNEEFNIRFSQLTDAIKLVYASIYSDESRSYFTAINYKLEEEKMAIVIQEVVGDQYENYFYPHISGTAQSHNYYPIAHMETEDGFAIAALGLGHYVVSGEKSFRFSPKYPNLDNSTPKILLRDTQVDFFALDLMKQDLDLQHGGSENNLARLSISEAEKHGTLNHLASVYDPDNDRVMPGLDTYGPRIIDFADILKYNYAPLADTINFILDIGKEALGCPVEIEYGVDLNKTLNGTPSFYLLQIKPLLGSSEEYSIKLDNLVKNELIVYAEKSMGNGKVDSIRDIVYVRKEHFNKMKTKEIVLEINRINKRLLSEKNKYMLVGPGRWGTRDPFIGIPVGWADISGARIIVETSLPDFPLDASLGSHFFHNVTSMNIGYMSIQYSSVNEFIDWDYIEAQEVIEETQYLRHVRLKEPMCILMDGKKRISVIYKDIYSKQISEL